MPTSRVATIGFFDGVHAGHRYLFQQLTDMARSRNAEPLLVTFDEHPAAVLRPESAPPLLTTTEERITLLQGQGGADHVLVLPFTLALASLTAAEFMRQLRDEHNVRTLVLGYDHRFGHDRLTRFEDYQHIGAEEGIEVVLAQEAPVPPSPWERGSGGEAASSSSIRRLLLAGQIEAANTLLTYPYFLRGSVVGGFRIGRQLGYPTANIKPLSPRKLVPANGVYAVSVDTSQGTHRGMLYIGNRPTFGCGERTIEVHLFDFQGNLYDEQLEIRFLRFIRQERTFASPEELRQQLAQDRQECR